MTTGTGFSISAPARPFVPDGERRVATITAFPAGRTTASPATATERLNARVLDAFRRLAMAEARVVVSEGQLLERLFAVRGHIKLGFAEFGDFVREALGISPRHASDRRMLSRLFRSRPNVEQAFLEGRITSCQALALRTVLTDDNEAMWIGMCRHLTVAELKERIRSEPKVDSTSPPRDEESFATISFTAPPAVVVAFDQAIETTRRVLGVNAPRYRCVEAILAEAAPHAAPDGDSFSSLQGPDGNSGSSRSDDVASRGSDDFRTETVDRSTVPFTVRPRIRITLGLIDRELEDFDDLTEADDSGDPLAIVAHLKALQTAARPLRYLAGRLLNDIRDTGSLTLAEFTGRHLKVSGQTARNLLHEALLFENTTLADAYGSGRIGIGQTVTIGRLAPADRLDAWIERAERVTHRQFQREASVFERLQDYFPALASCHPGPFPEPGLEARLRRELMDRGWSEEDIEAEIRRAGGANLAHGSDPAEDSGLMRRLEIFVEILIVTAFDTVPTPHTFANPALPMKAIRVRAPASIVWWWRAAIRAIQRERPQLPVWACATLLIREAVEQWENEAKGARFRGRAILERDGYLCQAPGCTQRRDLQVHHIRFRSQGGDNRPGNRITLCFAHHQILLHEMGSLAVSGSAPGSLRWTLGQTTLRGERYET